MKLILYAPTALRVKLCSEDTDGFIVNSKFIKRLIFFYWQIDVLKTKFCHFRQRTSTERDKSLWIFYFIINNFVGTVLSTVIEEFAVTNIALVCKNTRKNISVI